ncbi:MAG: hypothetical protein WCE75_05015 [Terracidiphilus sp.]
MSPNGVLQDVSCAVEVFLATALLHRENPERPDFTIQEIARRAAKENITGEMRSGVNVHASQHCVANKAPNPARHRMLFATGKHTRRLLMPGDEAHPQRTGRIFPDAGEIPERYLPLLEWAKDRYQRGMRRDGSLIAGSRGDSGALIEGPGRHLQALLNLRLAGVHLANGEDPDDYVRRLREGWE